MPVSQSFFEPGRAPAARHMRGVDASEYTRFVRMSATVAPYINTTTTISRPNSLGWRNQQANLDANVVSTLFSGLRPFVANK
jgi:hypothetical protein